MAPPPEGLEVRCAGCGETLEVDPGMTEFICPDCATPQSLPPELMPPPPPRRKALPLPRAAADVRGARLPCGSCGALLSVPVGLARCACPVCGTELAIDTARLRHYLLSSATAEGAVPVVPVGNSSAPPILQAQEAASARNRACQANVVAHHTAGTKSFARIIEEEKKKRPNKDGPTVTDLFILTHTHKNGKPTKKATADIIAQMREDSQKRAEGSGSDSTTHKSVLEFSSKAYEGRQPCKHPSRKLWRLNRKLKTRQQR
ncbi:hypothetical protein ACQ4PT_018571 [Festuca glaucescens]